MYFDLVRQNVYVDNYLELLHKYRLVQRPIYVDYYSLDIQNSVISKDVQGGTYNFMNQSGLKYKLIKNYPLQQFTNYTRTTTGNEGGVYNETEIDCLFIQMDNIKLIPSLYDFVIINFAINEQDFKDYITVFKVANIETLPILYRKTIYKIKLTSSGRMIKDIKNNFPCKIVETYYFDELSKRVYRESDYRILINSLEKIKQTRDSLNERTFDNYVGVFGNSALEF